MEMKKCPHCGADIAADAERCYVCKQWISDGNIVTSDKPQEFLPVLLFAYFWGVCGIHRFFTGNIPIGVAQLLTFGGCGIWAYIDFIMICFNKFKDAQGRLLRNYSSNIGITAFVISLIPFVLAIFLVIAVFMAVFLSEVR